MIDSDDPWIAGYLKLRHAVLTGELKAQEEICPGCEATVQASIIGLLPTPQLRTAAFLATLRTEVARRSGKEHTMTVTLCLPSTEVISIDAITTAGNRLTQLMLGLAGPARRLVLLYGHLGYPVGAIRRLSAKLGESQ